MSSIQDKGINTNYFDKIEINHLENDKLDLLLIDKNTSKIYVMKLRQLANNVFECIEFLEYDQNPLEI